MGNRGHFKPSGQEPRRGKGGRRAGAGRPSKAEVDALQKVRDEIERELERLSKRLARRYVQRAQKSDTVLRHAVERAVPAAKQEIGIEHKGKITSALVIETVDPHGMATGTTQKQREGE